MTKKAEPEDIHAIMDQAWKDHHHTRNQTWKALQMVAALGAGLIGMDARYANAFATTAAGVLVIIVAIIGISITIRHSRVERKKIQTITNCENYLGIFDIDILESEPDSKRLFPSSPQSITELGANLFSPRTWSVNSFIAKMHGAIILFTLIFVLFRWINS